MLELNEWFFGASLGLIAYVYLGFPVLLALYAVLRPRPANCDPATPSVSVIIPAYNEASVIIKKLNNTLALDYPHERLEIIVASDGSDDATNELVANYKVPGVKLLTLPRLGKNHALNLAVASAQGEVLVFTDADSMLVSDALRHLVSPFGDPDIGGVAGDFRYIEGKTGIGERTYWNFDRMLKRLQSQAGSVTSATGQLYAIRRSLFAIVPPGVTDDFFVSTQVLAHHQRLLFEPRAVAYGAVAETEDVEFRRKVRVATRGFNSVWHMRRLLNPLEYGFYSFQLLSHKVLRRVIGIPLIALLVTAPSLWQRGWFYQLATVACFMLHGIAVLGFLLQGTWLGHFKVLRLPFFFDMVNAAALFALANLLFGARQDNWTPHRSAANDALKGDV